MSERPMYTPRVKDGVLIVEFHDGLIVSFPVPSDHNDGDGVRKTLNMVVTSAYKLGASYGQCNWIGKEFRAAGYYIRGPLAGRNKPNKLSPFMKMRRTYLEMPTETRV